MVKTCMISLVAVGIVIGGGSAALAQRSPATPPVRSSRPVPRVLYLNPAADKTALQSRFTASANVNRFSASEAFNPLTAVAPEIIAGIKPAPSATQPIELTVKKPVTDDAYVNFVGANVNNQTGSAFFKQDKAALKENPSKGIKQFAADARVEFGFKGTAKTKYYVSVELTQYASKNVTLIAAPDEGTGFIGITFGQTPDLSGSVTVQPPLINGQPLIAEWVVDAPKDGWYGFRFAFADAPTKWGFVKITVQPISLP